MSNNRRYNNSSVNEMSNMTNTESINEINAEKKNKLNKTKIIQQKIMDSQITNKNAKKELNNYFL